MIDYELHAETATLPWPWIAAAAALALTLSFLTNAEAVYSRVHSGHTLSVADSRGVKDPFD